MGLLILVRHTSFAVAKEVLDLKGDSRCVEISHYPIDNGGLKMVDCSDVKPVSVEALRKLRLKIFQVRHQDK